MSNEKLSMKYWLFRDPYNGLLQSPHNWVVESPIYSKQPGAFFSLLKYETSVLTMAFSSQLMAAIPLGPSSDFRIAMRKDATVGHLAVLEKMTLMTATVDPKKKHEHVVWEKNTECSAIWTTSPARRASLYINLYHLGP